MRIGISGTQNIGKSTVVKDFMKEWPMYTTPEKTYRDVLKAKGLPCNQKTTPETQSILMDHICDSIINTKPDDMVITDRTPYDCLVYSLWAHAKGLDGFTDEFIEQQINIAREASSFYDIIFHIPIVKDHDIPIVDDELRDTDPEYRMEIDNLFSAVMATYFEQNGPFFKFDDCPAVIEMFGSREERIQIAKFYIDEGGGMFGEEDSLIADDLAGDIVGGEVPDIII